MKRFAGRRAVITGGASGIGEAVARRIEDEGGTVAIWDLQSAIAVDVADDVSVERAMQRTVAEIGGVDILVTSAAITGPDRKSVV